MTAYVYLITPIVPDSSIETVFSDGMEQIDVSWLKLTIAWSVAGLLLACGVVRVLYVRRMIREQIEENALKYIMLHSRICPVQRRVRARHAARTKQQQVGNR